MTQSGSEDQLTLFAEDILASPSALLGSDEAIKMTDISGRRCLGLSKLCGPAGLLEKMLLATSLWASTRCYLTWKPQVTPVGATLYRLSPQTPRTDATESGLWATPTAANAVGTSRPPSKGGGSRDLRQDVRMWPTPTARDYKDNGNSPAELARNSVTLATHAGGSLNPEFVEYLMGYPVGYTDLNN